MKCRFDPAHFVTCGAGHGGRDHQSATHNRSPAPTRCRYDDEATRVLHSLRDRSKCDRRRVTRADDSRRSRSYRNPSRRRPSYDEIRPDRQGPQRERVVHNLDLDGRPPYLRREVFYGRFGFGGNPRPSSPKSALVGAVQTAWLSGRVGAATRGERSTTCESATALSVGWCVVELVVVIEARLVRLR
jgi:hypothetical protein